MRRSATVALTPVLALTVASAVLVGCSTEHHDDPWMNPGQQERLAERYQRDEQTQQQLRDRMQSGQAQR